MVCNLYPFRSDPSIELIDVGGPTMVRAAAKNHAHVGVVVVPADYAAVLDELRRAGSLSAATRRRLARAAFAHTAAYDAAIVDWLDAGGPARSTAPTPSEDRCAVLPPTIHLTLERAEVLRYGENPHQHGARYRIAGAARAGGTTWSSTAGKELSYLNLFDADAAWRLVHELAGRRRRRAGAVAIIKHANPCGAAVAADLVTAYERALECDPQSAFGGIVAIGGPVTAAVAEAIAAGPAGRRDHRPVLRRGGARPADRRSARPPGCCRPRPRAAGPPVPQPRRERARPGRRPVRSSPRSRVGGGHQGAPTDDAVAGPGPGLAGLRPHHLQRHRRRDRRPGRRRRRRPAVPGGGGRDRRGQGRRSGPRAGPAASDAFFPFPDGLLVLAEAGVAAVVQPGGSVRDGEVIAAADEAGIAMVMTGERHFRH